jgi:hypothetical protein
MGSLISPLYGIPAFSKCLDIQGLLEFLIGKKQGEEDAGEAMKGTNIELVN